MDTLHTLANREVYPHSDAVSSVLCLLDDRSFWTSDATIEIRHLLVARWSDFSHPERRALEARIRGGPPRHLAGQAEPITDDDWQIVWDQLVFQHLEQLSSASLPLDGASERLLVEIVGRYPEGTLAPLKTANPLQGPALLGPRGDPAVLATHRDEEIVREALRIQQTDWLGHGDIWRLFCRYYPQRALRAILSADGDDRWRPEIVSPVLNIACEIDDAGLHAGISDLLGRMEAAQLARVAASGTWWLWALARRGAEADNEEVLHGWDILANVVYSTVYGAPVQTFDMTLDRADASAGGMLALVLVVQMSKRRWEPDAGFSKPFLDRLDIVAASDTPAGLQGRMILVRDLGFLEQTDPVWVTRHLSPRLLWNHAEAASLWRARAGSPLGRSSLVSLLNDAFLEAVRRAASDDNTDGLALNLVQVAKLALNPLPERPAPNPLKLRSALAAACAKMRERTAWVLWRQMAGEKGEVFNRAERWHANVRPIFDLIWPLDAAVREPDSSRMLTMMALECGDAFPDAVEAIVGLVVPFNIVMIGGWLQADPAYQSATAGHPQAFLRLLDALLSSEANAIPADLGSVLDECLLAAPSLRSDPSFVRLDALRRRQAA